MFILDKPGLIPFSDFFCYPLLLIDYDLFSGEILIEIIISMDNLPSNWLVLRKMCNAGEVIPQRLAGKLLINLTRNPIDRQVCQEVWTHINEHKCLNLQLVPNRIKESFRKICSFNEIKKSVLPFKFKVI